MPRSEAQKAAQKRYYEKNKAKINAQNAKYQRERYGKDPEFRERICQNKREANGRKKCSRMIGKGFEELPYHSD